MRLINIGFGNVVSDQKVVSIVSPESAPIKRLISDARDKERLVDATYGRRTRSVIVCDTGHIVLSAIQPETISQRFLAPQTIDMTPTSQRRVNRKTVATYN